MKPELIEVANRIAVTLSDDAARLDRPTPSREAMARVREFRAIQYAPPAVSSEETDRD